METTDKTIATEIFNQLGGNKFIAMTGAGNLYADNNGLGFKLPGTMTKDRINFVKVSLNCMDTYDLEFKSIWGGKIKIVSEVSGVYNDMLLSVIADRTGLCLNVR